MTSKLSTPPVPENPTSAQVPSEFPSRPKFQLVISAMKQHRMVVLLVPLLVLAVVAAGFGGYHFYLANYATKPATAQAKAPDPYAGWKTYIDADNPPASGISIRYPSDWHVTVGGKNVAWSIASAQASIAVIDIFQDGSHTARQVWESCYATDACLGHAGIRIVSGEETTINGLNAYKAAMQIDNGSVYHVAVIRGDKPTSNGVPYVIFTTYASDKATLNTYNAIMASASFGSSRSPKSAVTYLTIKEWGVKLPLSDTIKDAYYLPADSIVDSNGAPAAMWLSLRSLTDPTCVLSNKDRDGGGAIGELMRISPGQTDGVTGLPLSQEFPNGISVGGHYFAYKSRASSDSCTAKPAVQSADAAFNIAQKSVVALNQTNEYVIAEFNTKMTLPSELAPSDLTYVIDRSTPGATFAEFSTYSLLDVDKGCTAAEGSIGIIAQTTDDPKRSPEKEVGNYYYAFYSPQGSCTGGNLEQIQTALLKQAFATITNK